KAMLETGITPDFIVVDGAEGGTGAAPAELSDSVGAPLREGLVVMRNMLVGTGLKDRVKLGASGKIHSGAGMAIAFSIGADWCNAARAFMFSLGCIQSMRCHIGDCPTGVATQIPWRQQGLVVEDKAERVARFQEETVNALREIVVSMGFADPWEIGPMDLFQRPNSTLAMPFDRIYDFLAPSQLLEDAASTPYARAWDQAQADSFARAA
ncbi:MAG: FMN-binding glutamate synthase family protein, partial [Novosphingobium sp.]|nr:FMN-binding glutamate synthase family protein [Novosphingobium sp.]